jgi:diguanylate cyclase (GGDEF)-like protein
MATMAVGSGRGRPVPPARPRRRDRPQVAKLLNGALATIGLVGVVVAIGGAAAGALLHTRVWAIPIAAGLAIAVAAVAGLEYRRLRRAVVDPIDGLVRSVEAYDQGLRVGATSTGPDEVRRLAGGVRRMSARLDAATYGVRQRDERLAEYDGDVDTIVRMARLLSGSFNLAFILRTTAVAAVEVTRLPRAVVWLAEDSRLVARYDSGAPDVLSPSEAPIELGAGRVGNAALTNSLVVEPTAEDGTTPSAGIAIPLDSRGSVVGVVELLGDAVPDLTARQRRLVAVLAGHAATAVEASHLESEAELLIRTDASTGLANYRQFVSDLNAEVVRCNRYARPLALLIADIDRFSAFNEVHGRTRGDQVLSLVASLLENEARASDSAYRFGGDEFVVVAREVDAEAARSLAERVRLRFRARLEEVMPGAELSISFGIGDLATAADGAELVGRADEALIRAKALGYDRVVVAGGSRSGDHPVMAGSPTSGHSSADRAGEGPTSAARPSRGSEPTV